MLSSPGKDEPARARGPILLTRPALVELLGRGFDGGAVVLRAEPGYGKTVAVEQAAASRGALLVRVACPEAGGGAARLMELVAEGSERAFSDAGLAPARAPDEADAATARQMLDDVGRRAGRPVVILFDDAGCLREGDAEAKALVEAFLAAASAQASVAVATRRAIGLRTAKLRAEGRLSVVGADDLAFDASESASLLAAHGRVEPPLEEIEAIMTNTSGWPRAVSALARSGGSTLVRGPARAPSPRQNGGAAHATEIREASDLVLQELIEEVLDPLPPERRRALVVAALPARLDRFTVEAIGLDPDLLASMAAGGLFLRRAEGPRFALLPTVRELLLRRLDSELPDAELRSLRLALGSALRSAAAFEEALQHMLDAQAVDEALRLIEDEGERLLCSPPAVARAAVARLPTRALDRPGARLLRGHLAWRDGDHVTAAEHLRVAVDGIADHSGPLSPARLVLTDALLGLGLLEEVVDLVDGLGDGRSADSQQGGSLAAMAAIALASAGRVSESDAVAAMSPAALPPTLEALRAGLVDLPAGRLDRALGRFDAAAAASHRPDPIDSHLQAGIAAALLQADRGEGPDALARLARVGRLAEGSAENRHLAALAHAHRAALLAGLGRAGEADDALVLAGDAPAIGWRSWVFGAVPGLLAALRRDAGGVLAATDRVLLTVAAAPIVDRWRATSTMVPALVQAGFLSRAREALEESLAECSERVPGAQGSFLRARLLGQRAWLRASEGEHEQADADLVRAVEEAGGEVVALLRSEWARLRSLLWRGLEHERLDAEQIVRALALARPDDRGLVDLVRHPRAAVRRAAVGPALASGHPGALADLPRLLEDPDPRTAATAGAAAERLGEFGPPLLFGMFGEFTVRRGPWLVDDQAWERPMTARLVRFLLVHRDTRLPEDALFDAFWPDKDVAAARRALQVALSRARSVLDLPTAGSSVIDGRDRTYRLVLSERDLVDVDQFELAATAALGTSGSERLRRLDRARRLWTGEPLPEDRYAGWSLAWRERLKDRYAETLAHLIQAQADAGDAHGALESARELVAFDPLNEAGHRELMHALARTGRTADALRQFLVCRQLLVDELGVEPSAATARLQARILAGEQVHSST